MVVPGSTTVKRHAEAAGLDRVFRDAGFIWGESGCSMCAGGNGDRGQPRERCVSTTNRNFENRQGADVRTHLVGPAMAAAAAVTGRIVDVRCLARVGVMAPFTIVTGIAAPLLRDDINTDEITPIQIARSLEPDYAAALVHGRAPAARRQPGPRFRSQPAAILPARHPGDRAQFRLRLLARERGVGNARGRHRLHRRQELRRHLSRKLPAERRAAGGTRATPKPTALAARVVAADGAMPFTVDLVAQRIGGPGGPDIGFEIPAADRTRLLEGLDDIGLTLKHDAEIAAFEQRARFERPWHQTAVDSRR